MDPERSGYGAVKIDALFDAALDCMAKGDPATAAIHFEHIVALDAAHTEATHGLIRALQDAGRVDEALCATQRLVAAQPEDVLALTRLSMIFQCKGMIAEAEAAATRAKILGWKQELQSGAVARTDL